MFMVVAPGGFLTPERVPRAVLKVSMFSDASDLFLKRCVIQVPFEGLAKSVPVEEMHCTSVGFVSGEFKVSEPRWPVVGKEAHAIVSTFRGLNYHLWHRNSAYSFHPGANGTPTSRAEAQSLERWGKYMGQFRYKLVHILGAEKQRERPAVTGDESGLKTTGRFAARLRCCTRKSSSSSC